MKRLGVLSTLAISMLLPLRAGAAPGDVAPRQIGEEVELHAFSPRVERPSAASRGELSLVWSEVLQ